MRTRYGRPNMTVFSFVRAVSAEAVPHPAGQSVQDLFAMTPYYWNTPQTGPPALPPVKA